MDKTIIPIEVSSDGKRNAHMHCCMVVGHFRNYAVCLHLIDQRKDGRLSTIYADCSAAIGKKTCPALSMRAEEKREGHAIYFVERIKALGSAFTSAAAALLKPKQRDAVPEPKVEAKPVSKSAMIENIADYGYADAINAVVDQGKHVEPAKAPDNSKTVAPKVTKVEPKPETFKEKAAAIKGVVPVQGESLLELARRTLAAQK